MKYSCSPLCSVYDWFWYSGLDDVNDIVVVPSAFGVFCIENPDIALWVAASSVSPDIRYALFASLESESFVLPASGLVGMLLVFACGALAPLSVGVVGTFVLSGGVLGMFVLPVPVLLGLLHAVIIKAAENIATTRTDINMLFFIFDVLFFMLIHPNNRQCPFLFKPYETSHHKNLS